MCFSINKNARRPAHTRVWKVLQLVDDNCVRSPYFPEEGPGWTPGETYSLRTFAETTECDGYKANEGFYVFLNKAAAEAHATRLSREQGHFVVELIVSPKDFLFRSAEGDCTYRNYGATYRKVRVPKAAQKSFDAARGESL